MLVLRDLTCMTISDFSNLSEASKQHVISKHGNLLIDCLHGKFTIEIFSVHSIFVKVTSYNGVIKQFEVYKDLVNLKMFDNALVEPI